MEGDFKVILDAILPYVEAKRLYQEALKSCSRDAGYFCAHEREEMDESAKMLQEAFDSYIDKRIQAILDWREANRLK